MYSHQELDSFLEWCFFEKGLSSEALASEVFRFDEGNIQGILAVGQDQNLYVTFRGTDSMDDLPTDIRMFFGRLILPYPDVMDPDSPVRVHAGFLAAWLQVRVKVLMGLAILRRERPEARIYFIGHSLGGALAKLASLDFQYNVADPHVDKLITCVVFGVPRVGNQAFVNGRNQRVPQSYYVVNGDDPVFDQPWRMLGYGRGGQVIQLGSRHLWRWIWRRITLHFITSYRTVLRQQ